jgi:thioester reductase-like protein
MNTGLAVVGGTASTIGALAARIARVPVEDVDSTTRLSLLGIDSVGAIELAVAIEERFGIAMPADVMLVCRNIASLSEYVDAQLSSSCASTRDTGLDEMLADAVLPDDVAPREIRAIGEHRVRYTGGLLSARTILLTGATGFLGSWMVRELLDRSGARLICLVRGSDRRAGDRLHSVLLDAGVTASTIQRRIRIVDADLAAPRLGLSPETFDRLGDEDEISAICHAGASVNWVLPYRGLKAANVDGTRELLRLACRRGVPFHFVSSISVCHSTSAPPAIDERFDPLAHLGGIHLGYAQTKAVAEALVREAGRRGVPVTIYRPSFISGHGTSGAFNPDDILARVVAGCVRMRTAPDLDWVLDCMPVDSTARHILALSDRRGVVHLRHHQPRHWRECVLWMRLVGYDVRLVPYHAWLRQLEVETAAAGDPSHPLRPLRGFFLNRPAQAGGLTLPELLLATRVEIRGAAGHEALFDHPPLDASLLQRYFDAFVATGTTERPAHSVTENRTTEYRATEYTEYTEGGLDEGFFRRAMGKHVTAVEAAGRLSDHSVISELTAWRCGRPTGLFRYRVQVEGEPDSRELVVKLKASDRDSIAVGEALARICDERVGEAYARSAHRIGLAASHVRELAIYSHRDRRFVDHTPAVLGTVADESTGRWALVLEYVSNAVARDAAARPEEWTAARIDRALQGLASLHSIWVGQEAQLCREPWIGHVPSAVDVADMSDLWAAIGAHAAPRFSAWADPQICSIQRRLIATIDRWWPWLEQSPRTLIHNDFNPRNICLRNNDTRLVAYDWELATIGAPQRDLAELLCFVLTSETTTREIDGWVERYRSLFERASGIDVDAETWEAGFRASLYDLMLARLPMYALIHRVRPQSFLPRIVRTWRRIYESRSIAECRLSRAEC